jgi:hypothetical protein
LTATTEELNILDGVTATTAELNILGGFTATTAELNYLDITALGTTEASKVVTTDASNNIATTGTLASGALTVTGNATVTNDLLFTGTNPEIQGGDTDGGLYISGSTAANLGGNLTLFGDTNATRANDYRFRSAGTEVYGYDASAGLHDFTGDLTVTGTVSTTDSMNINAAAYADGYLQFQTSGHGVLVTPGENWGTVQFYSTDASGTGAGLVGSIECLQSVNSNYAKGGLYLSTADRSIDSTPVNGLIIDSSQNVSIPNGNVSINSPTDTSGYLNIDSGTGLNTGILLESAGSGQGTQITWSSGTNPIAQIDAHRGASNLYLNQMSFWVSSDLSGSNLVEMFKLYRNTGQDNVTFNVDTTANGVRINQSNTGNAVFIDQNGSGNALYTDGGDVVINNGDLTVTGSISVTDAATTRTNIGLATISQAEAEAGTSTTTRAWTAQRVGQAVAALASSGGVTPNKLISGLNTAYGTDTQHDVVIQPGVCTGQDDATVIELTSAITKQIDATWASGTNAGGLASGASLAANTWYHMFAVIAGGSADAMFDTSVTCANGVANNSVTFYRRIGSVKTDGSANILWYHQTGNYFLVSPVQLYAGAIGQYTTMNTPLGVKTRPLATVTTRGYYQLYLEDADPDFGAKNWKVRTNASNTIYGISLHTTAYTDLISRLYFRASADTNYGYVICSGWVDPRGEY